MLEDPYVQILGHFKKPPRGKGIRIGKVLTPLPNITIKMGDMQLDGDDLWIPDYLTSGYEREIEIPESPASGITSDGKSISKIGIASVKVKAKTGLVAGDEVALMPTDDGQTYFIIARRAK